MDVDKDLELKRWEVLQISVDVQIIGIGEDVVLIRTVIV